MGHRQTAGGNRGQGGRYIFTGRAAEESSLTRPGTAIGTPAYMSPEQAAGNLARVDRASDIYSLGATLYCLLVGQGPFPSGSVADVLERVRRGIFPAPRRLRRSIDPTLEAICLKAMVLEQQERHATALRSPGRSRRGSRMFGFASSKSERRTTSNGRWSGFASRRHNLFGRDMPGEGMLWPSRALRIFPRIRRVSNTSFAQASLAGMPRPSWSSERSHGGSVIAVTFSPDGRRLATASDDRTVRLWDMAKVRLVIPDSSREYHPCDHLQSGRRLDRHGE